MDSTAYVFVVIDKVQKGVMTAADRGVFSDVKIFNSVDNHQIIVRLLHSNETYFNNWVTRVNGVVLTSRNKMRTFIEEATGDAKDRMADGFKFAQLLLYSVANIYENSTSTLKTAMNADVKAALDAFIVIRDANPELFNVDLKDSWASEMVKIVNREKDVKDIIKAVSTEEEI